MYQFLNETPLSFWVLAAALFGAALYFRKQGRLLPPGPPAWPLIGNILNVSPKAPWIKFTEMKNQYGDLVFFHGLGNNVLVLNSLEAINDLMDKRATNYSHRPTFTVVGELMALGLSMPLLPYAGEWRAQRKLAHAGLSPSAVKQYFSVQEDLSALLNKAIIDKPENFFAHVRLAAQRIVLSVTYGLSASAADNEYIEQAEETMDIIGKATVPGAFLADLIPILKYAPSWVPFQKQAKHGKMMIDELVTKPYQHVKREMDAGIAKPSLTQQLLSEAPADDPLFDDRLRWAMGSMYGAGGETTYSTVLIFIMLMALHPDVQKKLQAEVDSVIGTDRLPVIADRGTLPYLTAVIKETMRWHPVLPLSIARRSAEDDEYKGYFIPKGTVVIPNSWTLAFEPNSKYDPYSFNPDRYLDPDENVIDPAVWAFGFGRRICPGKYLAENSLFVLISNIVSIFDITPPAKGEIKPTFGPNLVSYPDPFECTIKPRSKTKVDLVESRVLQCTV